MLVVHVAAANSDESTSKRATRSANTPPSESNPNAPTIAYGSDSTLAGSPSQYQSRRLSVAARQYTAWLPPSGRREATSHLEGVPGGDELIVAYEAKDPSDSSGGPQGDGQPAIELGLVPVHLGQREDLLGECPRGVCCGDDSQGQWDWDVHARVDAEELHAAAGVEQVPVSIKGEESAA